MTTPFWRTRRHIVPPRAARGVRRVAQGSESAVRADQPRRRVVNKNQAKFEQVLLYVLNKVGDKPKVGETVLHKLLYFIDFDFYEKFEENLMGATYIKNEFGPTANDLADAARRMAQRGEIKVEEVACFDYRQKRYRALKLSDLSALSAQEREHIDGVLARFADKTATELSAYSHGDVPWVASADGEPISYELVFYRDHPYTTRTYDDEL